MIDYNLNPPGINHPEPVTGSKEWGINGIEDLVVPLKEADIIISYIMYESEGLSWPRGWHCTAYIKRSDKEQFMEYAEAACIDIGDEEELN